MGIKFVSVIGTRPEIIRVIRGLKDHFVCDTGQHYDPNMADDFWLEQNIQPDTCLDAKTFQDIYDGLCKMYIMLEPQHILVYGDTRSSLAAAISAFEKNIPVVHIESGGRAASNEPEEKNRKIIDHLSKVLFVANNLQKNNLVAEGVNPESIHIVGDMLYDRFLEDNSKGKYALVTLHRQENHDPAKLKAILAKIDLSRPTKIIIHPGMKDIFQTIRVSLPETVEYIEPVPHKKMLDLIRGAELVLTDSGGVQREAYWLGKRVVLGMTASPWQREIRMFGDGMAETRIKQILSSLT